ncbi:MAG: GatB/YqeY domain-containing protein [Acidobacteriota bacterium]|nr:GatB/YqeY domain-containing protein [Acidobacteriota bacterium]
MSLKNKIIDDMKTAMRAKEKEKLSVLRMVKSLLMNQEIEKGSELNDEDVIKSLNTLVKQRKDSAEQYENAGRTELAEKENSEISVIEDYLPQAATNEEIEQAVAEAVEETGANSMKDMGNVMKAALSKLSDKTVDGKMVSEIVREKLENN